MYTNSEFVRHMKRFLSYLVPDEVVVEADLGELEDVPHGAPVEGAVGQGGTALGIPVHITAGRVGQFYVLKDNIRLK